MTATMWQKLKKRSLFAIARCEDRLLLSGVITGTVMQQFPQYGGSMAVVPLVDWYVYDDLLGTGTFAPGDPVASTNLEGIFSLPVGDGPATVRLVPRSGWTAVAGSGTSQTASAGDTLNPFVQTMSDPTVIDVVASYTALADQAYQPTDTTPPLAGLFNYANQVQGDSDTNVQIKLTDAFETQFTESNSLQADLQALSSAAPSDIVSARAANQADLTVLFEGDTPRANNGEVGLAFEFNRFHPNAAKGDAVVELLGNPVADGNLLAHELGHLLGADHDPPHAHAPATWGFARGYKFVGDDQQAYQDVMSYGAGTVLPFYSTPDAFYQGGPLGRVTNGNNARAIRINAPVVARYATEGDEGPASTAAILSSQLVLAQSLQTTGRDRTIIGGQTQVVSLKLTNAGDLAIDEFGQVELKLVDTQSTAGDAPAIFSVNVLLKLPVGRSRSITVRIAWPTDLANAPVTLIAYTAAAGVLTPAADGSGLTAGLIENYQQPAVNVSLKAVSSVGRAVTAGRVMAVSAVLDNIGNARASGSADFTATLLKDGETDALTILHPDRRLSLVPAGRQVIVLLIHLPIMATAGGAILEINMTDLTTLADLDATNKRFTIALTFG